MTLPPEETPSETSAPRASSPAPAPPASLPPTFPASQRQQVGIALALLVFFTVLRGVLLPETPEMRQAAERISRISDALRLTKIAYSEKQESPARTARPSPREKRRFDPSGSALEAWRDLANAPTARASDWRRYGIALAQFGAGDSRKQALVAFRHLATLPPPPATREKTRGLSARARAEIDAATSIPIAEEVRLWETIYGDAPLDSKKVPEIRATLSRLRLLWFEHLAAADLYRKAGKNEEARAEIAAAQTSVEALDRITSWQGGAFAVGVFALVWVGLQRLVRKRTGFPLPSMFVGMGIERDDPAAFPKPLPAFFYHSRMVAFIVYMGLPLFLVVPSLWLSGAVKDWSANAMGRLNVAFYLLTSALLVLATLATLRRLAVLESPDHRLPSLRATLTALGFRTRHLATDIGTGLLGHAMVLPVMLAASALSNWVFRRFTTPPHPVMLSLLAMNTPLDRALMLLETALTAAVVEEMMFRGVLYPALRQRWGVRGGIALSAAIFAIIHPTLPAGFLPLWVLGASFAYVYEKRGSLLPGILMHALNNGLLLLSQYAVISS